MLADEKDLIAALFKWPIAVHSLAFIATFGRVLRFHRQYLKIAGTFLYALEEQHHLGLDPTAAGVPAKRKFYGAHLRTDVDAIAAHFASSAEQSAASIKAAESHDLNFIYLASGSLADITQFTLDSATRGLTVVTKDLLLSAPEFADVLPEVKSLAWDQQALVDYLVLLRSSYFSGTWASSFAWDIAFRRHVVVLGSGEGVHSYAAMWKLGHPGGRRGRRGEMTSYLRE